MTVLTTEERIARLRAALPAHATVAADAWLETVDAHAETVEDLARLITIVVERWLPIARVSAPDVAKLVDDSYLSAVVAATRSRRTAIDMALSTLEAKAGMAPPASSTVD
jgi:hypothetical protein